MNISSMGIIRNGSPVTALPGEQLELTYGDALRINVEFEYRGEERTVSLYGALGRRGAGGFAEDLHNEVEIELPESRDFLSYGSYV